MPCFHETVRLSTTCYGPAHYGSAYYGRCRASMRPCGYLLLTMALLTMALLTMAGAALPRDRAASYYLLWLCALWLCLPWQVPRFHETVRLLFVVGSNSPGPQAVADELRVNVTEGERMRAL